jgi:hypothetical protein
VITLERSVLLGAGAVTSIATRSPMWLVLGSAACALLVVIEREEERRRLYGLRSPAVEDLEPEERKRALEAYGAAQALLNAIALSSESVKESFSEVAAHARRLAELHMTLVRTGRTGPELWSIKCALEYAREAVLDARCEEGPGGEAVAAELSTQVTKAKTLLQGGES